MLQLRAVERKSRPDGDGDGNPGQAWGKNYGNPTAANSFH